MNRPLIFVSYSRKDEAAKNALLSHLGILAFPAGTIDVWSDDRIGAGEDWRLEIHQAMTRASVAILLLSSDFLSSAFVRTTEVPVLLQRKEQQALVLFPIVARACAWQALDWLTRMNVRPRGARPVWSDGERHVDDDLAAITREIADIVREQLVPHNLEVPAGGRLIGRENETQELQRILESDNEPPVVALVGPIGSGRSSLAREVAHHYLELSRQNPDDPRAFEAIVWVAGGRVPLRAAAVHTTTADSGLARLYHTVAVVLKGTALLQARPAEQPRLVQELLGRQRVLLVLDDADETHDPGLVGFLRSVPASCRVLAVSQTALGAGERVVPLSPLSPDLAVDLMHQQARDARVPALDGASAADLRQLARQTGGLPLALQLAVALSGQEGESVHGLSARIPTTGRGQSVVDFLLNEVTVGLAPDERRLLEGLALYPRPTGLEAAGAAGDIAGDELRAALTQLARIGLVQQDEHTGYCSMPPLVQRHCLALLEQDHAFREAATARAIRYMAEYAERNARPGDWRGLDRIAAQVENFLWAMRQAYDRGQWREVLHFRRFLGDCLHWRGYWNEAASVGRLAYRSARQLEDRKEAAWCALYPLARAAFHQGRYALAARWSRRSLRLFRGAGDDYGTAAACRYLGRSLQAQGHVRRAHALFALGLKKARKFNSTSEGKNLQGYLLSALAGLAYEEGRDGASEKLYREALALYEETRDQPGIADVLHRLGDIANRRNRPEEAETLLNESLKLGRETGSGELEAEVTLSLALVAERQGRLPLALERLERARRWFQSLAAGAQLRRTEQALLRVQSALGQLTRAGEPEP